MQQVQASAPQCVTCGRGGESPQSCVPWRDLLSWREGLSENLHALVSAEVAQFRVLLDERLPQHGSAYAPLDERLPSPSGYVFASPRPATFPMPLGGAETTRPIDGGSAETAASSVSPGVAPAAHATPERGDVERDLLAYRQHGPVARTLRCTAESDTHREHSSLSAEQRSEALGGRRLVNATLDADSGEHFNAIVCMLQQIKHCVAHAEDRAVQHATHLSQLATYEAPKALSHTVQLATWTVAHPSEAAHNAKQWLDKNEVLSLARVKEIVGFPLRVAALPPIALPQWFEHIMLALAVVNIVQVGACTGETGKIFQDECRVFESIFAVIFAMEMVVMISAFRCAYFRDSLCILDFFVACLAVINSFILEPFFMSSDGEAGNPYSGLMVFRIFRMLRLLRMIKIVKMKPELYVLVVGIVASLRAMMWIAMLLGMAIFAHAILFMELLELAGEPEIYRTDDWQRSHFGSLPVAMMTLFDVCILAEWTSIVRPIMKAQPYVVPILIAFTGLTNFGLLNVIIGVISDKTSTASREAEEAQELSLEEERMEHALNLVSFMQTHHGDELTRDDFDAHPEVLSYLKKVNLPTEFTVDEFFLVLNGDGRKMIHLNDLLLGMCRMIRADSFQGLCMVHLTVARINQTLLEFERRSTDILTAISAHISSFAMPHGPAQPLSLPQRDPQRSAAATAQSNNG